MGIIVKGACQSCDTTRVLMAPDYHYCSEKCQARGPSLWPAIFAMMVIVSFIAIVVSTFLK